MKVLVLGDSPLRSTGFGRVNKHAVNAFVKAGWEVAAVGALDPKEHSDLVLPYRLYTPDKDDPMALRCAVKAIEDFQPDRIYSTGEPGTVAAHASVVPARIPYTAYVPVEGEPIVLTDWRRVLTYIDFFTCSEYGAEVVKADVGKDVDWVYHGVDRETFTPLSDDERAAFRTRLGWDGKFVIICVAQNVRRKQWPRLFEAVAELKHRLKQDDVILYVHSVPFQQHWLEGWNLIELARAFGIGEQVVFNPLLAEWMAAVPERGTLDLPGLRELVGAADLFVLPSQVEGFGLPIAEAMACGTPVAVTEYAAGWEVARKGLGAGLPIKDWEIHKSGTRYANVDPHGMAKVILGLKRDPKRLARMRAAGLEGVNAFDWAKFEEMVVAKVAAAEAHPLPETPPEAHPADASEAA